MISSALAFLNFWSLPFTFLCHSVTFACALYIAVHSRDLKAWAITPLWYLGICSGFIASTIVVEWAVDIDHPLSYSSIGKLGETASEIILATLLFITFLHTVRSDIVNRKHRK